MQHANSERWALALMLAAAAALRIYGIWFGLPLESNFYVRPDESLIVQAAVALFERAGYPGFFAYPALMVELCAVLYTVLLNPFTDFAANPSAYFLVPRFISVAAGTTTIAVVYQTAKQLLAGHLSAGRWALWAAALYAVSPLAVRDAHFGVTDTLLTMWVALAMQNAVRYARGGASAGHRTTYSAWWWSAFFFALAISTKYTVALASPLLLACLLERHGWRNWRAALSKLGGAALLIGGVFAALNPYVFLRGGDAVGTVSGLLQVFYGGASNSGYQWSATAAVWQVLFPLLYGPGSWAGLALAGASVYWIARQGFGETGRSQAGKAGRISDDRGLLTLACGSFPFLLALLPFQHGLPFRYLLPALPGVAVIAAFALARLAGARRLSRARRPLRLGLALAVGAVAIVLWQAAQSAALVAALGRADTRNQAGAWVAASIPIDVPVLLLGPPEAEPQIRESAASIERRIAYVYGLYGDDSGRIVSELYRLLRRQAGDRREVYRNVAPETITSRRLLIVAPSYPLKLVGAYHAERAAGRATVLKRMEFDPLLGDAAGADFDTIDAFLLPMNPMGRVTRPGPHLTAILIDREEKAAGEATTGR